MSNLQCDWYLPREVTDKHIFDKTEMNLRSNLSGTSGSLSIITTLHAKCGEAHANLVARLYRVVHRYKRSWNNEEVSSTVLEIKHDDGGGYKVQTRLRNWTVWHSPLFVDVWASWYQSHQLGWTSIFLLNCISACLSQTFPPMKQATTKSTSRRHEWNFETYVDNQVVEQYLTRPWTPWPDVLKLLSSIWPPSTNFWYRFPSLSSSTKS